MTTLGTTPAERRTALLFIIYPNNSCGRHSSSNVSSRFRKTFHVFMSSKKWIPRPDLITQNLTWIQRITQSVRAKKCYSRLHHQKMVLIFRSTCGISQQFPHQQFILALYENHGGKCRDKLASDDAPEVHIFDFEGHADIGTTQD